MNTRANSASARDIAYHVHGYTNLKKHEDVGPHIIESGSGIRVTDDNGNSYIEGLAGLWCTSLGFSEQRLIDAAMAAFKRLPYYHGFGGRTPDVTIELAERLVKMAPVPMSKALFANSGSEATDLSLKLVWYYHNAIGKPEKKKIISRFKGYHGVTVASASLTGLPHLHTEFDLPIDRIMHTSCPHHYRFGEEGESEEHFATRCAMDLEDLIERESADTIAAFYAEPIMGAGGVLVPPKTYFEKIQKVLKKHNILLIADEVICGFGRTGNMWGSTTLDMKPDMITMAKALSSAYLPISALLINEKIYQAMVDQSEKLGLFGHGGTYAGHPVSAAVALETLNIYEERDIVGHVQKMAPLLQAGLRSFSDHPLVGEVRGVGLIAGVEIIKNKETKEPFDPKLAVGAQCQSFTLENGLIIRAVGDTLAFCPPLIINEVEIAELIASFSKGLDQTWSWVKDEGYHA
jgi:4-aminobutyrate--pyruvate transaminase